MNTLEKIISAAHAGGTVLTQYFGTHLTPKIKSVPSDYQTIADTESERAVMAVLENYFPDYSILSEESGHTDKNSDWEFIIDPLDGTNNFVLGVPFFSVAIGLHKNRVLEYGVVYNPIINKTYSAERGQGAFANGVKIHVNTVSDMRHISAGFAGDYKTGHGDGKDAFQKAGIKRFLSLWSPALVLCLIAEGKVEAYGSTGLAVHDFAGAKLIAKEAGAKITDFNGAPEIDDLSAHFLLSNGTKVHEEILELLRV